MDQTRLQPMYMMLFSCTMFRTLELAALMPCWAFPQQGIVHRDVKSENVFRTAEGTWKLGDFGSALRLGDARLMTKQPLKLEGTFSFAAPEYIAIWNSFTRQELLSATTFKVGGRHQLMCARVLNTYPIH